MNETIASLREKQIVEEMGNIFSTISNGMVIPLFLFFWLADCLYIPNLKWQTLGLRLLVIPIVIFGRFVLSKPRSFRYLQVTMSIYAFFCAFIINSIVFLMKQPESGYYAGLNLIALGSLSFIPFTIPFLALTAFGIYVPFFVISYFQVSSNEDFRIFVVNTFFIIGTLTICAVIKYFNENLRCKELSAQLSLNKEIALRGEIIELKTKESTQLKQLSAQFSPQVVAAIRSGEISLNKNLKNQKICVVFLDIVNSTERVVNRPADDVQAVIEFFLKTTISTFLKYDLTIDKFQGDGILAFSNSPIEHHDFVARVGAAVIEVFRIVESEQTTLKAIWGGRLELRAGVAVGYATVGFFGDKKNYNTFTAIGRPLPLASRLSSASTPNQILVDFESATELEKSNFRVSPKGSLELKGFTQESVQVFELSHFSKQNAA